VQLSEWTEFAIVAVGPRQHSLGLLFVAVSLRVEVSRRVRSLADSAGANRESCSRLKYGAAFPRMRVNSVDPGFTTTDVNQHRGTLTKVPKQSSATR
jgi:hypothetical protein